MPPKPLCCALLRQQLWHTCGSLRSPLPAGLCWKGHQWETQPLLYQITLTGDIKTRCQENYVAACNKSSCYPCHLHRAVLVNQDMFYLSTAFPCAPHFSDSCTNLRRIYKGKADSVNRGRRLPPSYGEGRLCWKLNLYEYSSTAPLPSLCRKHAGAWGSTSLTQHQTQSISSTDTQRFLMTAALISKNTPVMVKKCRMFVWNNNQRTSLPRSDKPASDHC